MDNPIPEIIAYERRVWDALVNADRAADAHLLHPQFIGVYPDGFADRDAHSGQLAAGPTVNSYTLNQIRTERLGADHALICYRATFSRSAQGAQEVMYVSSVWRRDATGWRNIFSQDTPAL